MKGYEVTERGKFIIVVLVIAILIIPATVVAFRVWNGSQPLPLNSPDDYISEPTPNGSEPGDLEPVVTENPPHDDNGLEPDDPPGESNGEQGSFDPPVEPPVEPDDPGDDDLPPDDVTPDEPPEIGLVNINRTGGTMSFMFAPDQQNALDSDTISTLGEFVTSPRNTDNSVILVEMPDLPASQKSALTAAIADAFSKQGITRSGLLFETYAAQSGDSSFEVRLSFVPSSSPK